MLFIHNSKFLPIAPIKNSQVDSIMKGGLAITAQKRELTKSSVLFDCTDGLKAGAVVYLKPDAGFTNWNKEIFNTGSFEFVLAPIEAILFIEK